jgi:hypothetical protein
LACSDGAEKGEFRGFDDELVLESEHFRFHAHAGDGDACDNALIALERHRAAISRFLGLGEPATRIDYYKFASVEELQGERACSIQKSPACVHSGQVRSPRLLDRHELIHAYVEPSRPPWIFIEGLADVLSCDYGPWSRPRDHANFDDVSVLDWRELAAWVPDGGARDLTFYRAGAQLMRYLFDSFGVEAVLHHYRSARATTAADDVNSDFAATFDQSLKSAWQAALALDLPGGPCLTPFECSHDPLEVGENWQVEARCGIGYEYRTFELAREQGVVMSAPGARDVLGERDSLDMLMACDGLTAAPTWASFYPPRLATRLAAGRYVLVLPRPQESLKAQLSSFAAAPSCEAALEQPLVIGDAETVFAAAASAVATYVALSAEASLVVERQAAGTELRVRVCSGCSANADCLELNSARQLDPSQMPVVRFDGASDASDFTLLGIRTSE